MEEQLELVGLRFSEADFRVREKLTWEQHAAVGQLPFMDIGRHKPWTDYYVFSVNRISHFNQLKECLENQDIHVSEVDIRYERIPNNQ